MGRQQAGEFFLVARNEEIGLAHQAPVLEVEVHHIVAGQAMGPARETVGVDIIRDDILVLAGEITRNLVFPAQERTFQFLFTHFPVQREVGVPVVLDRHVDVALHRGRDVRLAAILHQGLADDGPGHGIDHCRIRTRNGIFQTDLDGDGVGSPFRQGVRGALLENLGLQLGVFMATGQQQEHRRYNQKKLFHIINHYSIP